MATNELAIRFTEEKYSTKAEVAKELKITTIDSFWDNILSYRSQFNRYLTLKTIDRNMLVFCGCQSVNSLINNVENKLIKINREYSKLFANPNQLSHFYLRSKVKILKNISEKYGLSISEDDLYSVFAGENSSYSKEILKTYGEMVDFVAQKHVNRIDENYLADLFGKINNLDEITSYYRIEDENSRENKVLVDRIYTSAPANQIDSMMDDLFLFVSRSNVSPLLKAILSYFYIIYIKPFDKYSDELAMLFSKSILCHESLGDLGAYLPFEELFSKYHDDILRLINETQKTFDVTYYVIYVLEFLSNKADEIQDFICNLNIQEIKNDFYQNDEEPLEKSEDVQTESVKTVKEKDQVKEKIAYVKEELAVDFIPVALDEKQAALLEQDLLERDPSLKKGEAHFYARHCSKGRKYTIAQYKKCMRCAYETARTSMDHLAALHYYQKEQFKNKFVYTPIVR